MPEVNHKDRTVTPKLELCVSTKMENLTVIGDFVASVAKEFGLDDDVTFAVQMAVDEACANVMEHAYCGKSNGMVRLTCQILDDDLVVTIHDHGRAFDPQTVPRPDITAPLEKRGEGALGLYLMEKLMDSVEFQFDAVQGNTLIMKKRLHRGKQAL